MHCRTPKRTGNVLIDKVQQGVLVYSYVLPDSFPIYAMIFTTFETSLCIETILYLSLLFLFPPPPLNWVVGHSGWGSWQYP